MLKQQDRPENFHRGTGLCNTVMSERFPSCSHNLSACQSDMTLYPWWKSEQFFQGYRLLYQVLQKARRLNIKYISVHGSHPVKREHQECTVQLQRSIKPSWKSEKCLNGFVPMSLHNYYLKNTYNSEVTASWKLGQCELTVIFYLILRNKLYAANPNYR